MNVLPPMNRGLKGIIALTARGHPAGDIAYGLGLNKDINIRLLLDSGVVAWTMAYNPILVMISSFKFLFFKGLKNE